MSHNLPIKTKRLTLRRIDWSDGPALLEVYGEAINYFCELYRESSEEFIIKSIEQQLMVQVGDPGVPFRLGVIEGTTGQLIGFVDITVESIEDCQGEVWFALNQAFWGKGYASEAVHAALGFGFHSMDLHRIFAGVATGDERAWRLMERIGMRREAHFIHANKVDDTYVDDYIYAMLEDEWTENVER